MHYLSRDQREVYLYDFARKEKQTVLTLSKRDGIVSHMKFLGDSLYYVKNTKDLVRYDLKKHSSHLIGTTRDAVIALHVTRNQMREVDHAEEEKVGGMMQDDEIDEENKEDSRFTVCCIDESEHLYVYKGSTTGSKKPLGMSTQVKFLSNLPEEIVEKDLFGMGYPYFVSLYSDMIAFSTDYGVAYLKYDPSKLA